ncbi:hypothetical protein F5880DRAFT_1604982 [Lentinula raphanica]|nr:hypothetical protein F5880DRAFT_1604982 [Lentinula raphanica]
MLPQSSASSGEVGTGLFAPATEYIPTGGSSLGPLFSAHQPSAWNLDPLPLAQEGPIPHHNLSSDWHSFLHTSRGGFIEESNSQHQFGDTGSRLDAPSEYANSQHYAPAQSGAPISSPSESVSTYRNLPDHTLSTPLASDNYPLPSNSPFLSGWQEPLHVSIETTRRLSILEQLCNSPSTNSSTWSSHSSLFSTPSSVTQSPLVNTPSMMQRPSLVGVGYSPSTHYNLALSPVSAGIDSGFLHGVDSDGRPLSFAPSRQSLARHTEIGFQRGHSPSFTHHRLDQIRRASSESRGITARSRRRHSGTALTFDPMRSRARRREESSDRNLTIPAPTHDDNGVHAVSKEERQCSPAQVLPTVDVQDDEAVPALVSVSPKKLQVASAALINAANARRTNEAPFRCTFAGCKATFTAKHNLNNHVNSHYGIKSFQCAKCGRDFGTGHVLRRHLTTCKGTGRKRPR